MTTSTNNTSWMNLTWDDLNHWAGDRTVRRGKSYQRHIKDLCVMADGALLASVQGTALYTTRARLNADNTLFSECTCSYSWGHCKHAVAVILVYLDACKNKQTVPPAASDDERLQERLGEKSDTDDFEDSDDGEAHEDHEDRKTQRSLSGPSGS